MQKYLRKKPTFNELINYIEVEQPKIKYPDRTATFLRNTHYLSQFDGLFDLEEQEKQITKEQIREKEIVRTAATTGTASLIRSTAAQQQNRSTAAQATQRAASEPLVIGKTSIFDMTDDDDPKPAPPIADTSLDRIADEAMEQAYATEEQAQV